MSLSCCGTMWFGIRDRPANISPVQRGSNVRSAIVVMMMPQGPRWSGGGAGSRRDWSFVGAGGYWGNCLMTLLPPKRSYSGHLERLVEEFLAAKHGGVETMRTFINTQLAETFEEESERPVPAEILYNRAREAGEYAQSDFPEKDIPAGVLMLS